MAQRSKSSKAWLHEHVNDHYVHMAQKDGYRARAAYKLLEINEKDKIIKPGTVLADLGSAPGSWSQVAAKLAGGTGKVFALDILPMEPIAGVDFVICDMAPNMAGNAVIDQTRSIYLCELALDFAAEHLKPGGTFLVKVFQGSGFQEFQAAMKSVFATVATRKPEASRNRSNEIYLLGRNKR